MKYSSSIRIFKHGAEDVNGSVDVLIEKDLYKEPLGRNFEDTVKNIRASCVNRKPIKKANLPENLHGFKARWLQWKKGKKSPQIDRIYLCQIVAIALKISRLAQEILENSRKLEKELKRMGKIAMSLTDVITISAPTEVDEDPGTMISKIEEDLESFTIIDLEWNVWPACQWLFTE